MNKTLARALLLKNGRTLSGTSTFASQNTGAGFYWLNPNVSCLSKDWSLILNDIDRHTLHLFEIPANSIKRDDVICRADRPEYIDIQIVYGVPTFTDKRSGIAFSTWLKASVTYD